MQLYLDTSALVKLVVVEAESTALRSYLGEHASDIRTSAALARTELVRAAAIHGSIETVENARSIIARLNLIALNNRLLDAAATIMPKRLRTLGAIHLAAALTALELRALVTYDSRLADAAVSRGITVVTPR